MEKLLFIHHVHLLELNYLPPSTSRYNLYFREYLFLHLGKGSQNHFKSKAKRFWAQDFTYELRIRWNQLAYIFVGTGCELRNWNFYLLPIWFRQLKDYNRIGKIEISVRCNRSVQCLQPSFLLSCTNKWTTFEDGYDWIIIVKYDSGLQFNLNTMLPDMESFSHRYPIPVWRWRAIRK